MERRGAMAAVIALALTLAVALLAVLPSLAAAHPLRSAAHGIPHGTDGLVHAGSARTASAGWIFLAALVLAGLTSLAGRRHLKRVAVSSLALALGLFALEAAVHSVHHLSDADAAARCVVLSASQHVDGASLDLPVAEGPAPVQHAVLLDEGEGCPSCARFRLDAGRAPPSPSV
jgi:hypothetical protein